MSIEQEFFMTFEVPEREITAEIVLNLEEVIFNKYHVVIYQIWKNVYYLMVYEEFMSEYLEKGVGETRTVALLDLCIQLKDEIKEAVQEVLA